MSDILDKGSWVFAAVSVLIVAAAFFLTVNAKLETAVQTAQRVVDADQKKLDQIKADLAAKKITIENARAQASRI